METMKVKFHECVKKRVRIGEEQRRGGWEEGRCHGKAGCPRRAGAGHSGEVR